MTAMKSNVIRLCAMARFNADQVQQNASMYALVDLRAAARELGIKGSSKMNSVALVDAMTDWSQINADGDHEAYNTSMVIAGETTN